MRDATLREMSEAEFSEWFARSIGNYASDFVAAYDRSPEAARADAEADAAAMLPDGRATPGNHFLRVIAADGAAVGWLWLGPIDDGVMWIYDVEIDASVRRRGHGRATMLAAEAFARSLGAQTLALNVFGHNPNAHTLYESLGYRTVSTRMRKPL